MAVSAHDVARDLRRRLPRAGIVKIHKLLYYCQGWHLAWTGTPLFGEDVEAWANGPVVADLWHDEDKSREGPPATHLPEDALGTIGYVVSRYGRLSGKELIRLTHGERPWLDVSESDAWRSPVISHEALASFFAADDERADLDAVFDAAWSDPPTRSMIETAIERSNHSDAVTDDPAEIERRLSALR